jgi:arsenite methyltransferase
MNKLKANYGQELIPLLSILSIIDLALISAIVYLLLTGSSAFPTMLMMGLAAIFFGIIIATSIWSSRIGKLIMRDKLIDELHLKGNENVLDIGCGKGLLAIGIAKKLTTGKVTGMDHWQGTFEYKYTRQMAEKNVEFEGLGNRVEIIDGDAQQLPFEAEKFDIITSSLVIHHVPDSKLAFGEMRRTLKPDGIIAIADMPSPKIRRQIIEAGFEIIVIKPLVRLFFIQVGLVIAKKINK